MKLNQDKCQLLVLRFKSGNVWAKIGKAKIWEGEKQKLLGVEMIELSTFINVLLPYVGKLERNYLF